MWFNYASIWSQSQISEQVSCRDHKDEKGRKSIRSRKGRGNIATLFENNVKGSSND